MTARRFLLPLLFPLLAAAAEPVPNRAPLQPAPFIPLPLGAVSAGGWLAHQLELQADGLTGNAARVIPELGPDNAWRGGTGESWEKGPYFLRGLVSLAHVKNDPALKQQAAGWIDWLLGSQRESGQIGPASNNDWWPRMVITWTLREHFEATGDPRVIPVLLNYSRFMLARLPDQPLHEWAKARAGDQIATTYWLYNRTGEPFLLELADLLRRQANHWQPFLTQLARTPGDFRVEHGVNISQAMKFPVMEYLRTGRAEDRRVFSDAWDFLTEKHGLPTGMWSGTEALAGRSTTQGIEMCSIVEQMLSHEVALAALGDARLGDELERIAFNLLPGGTSKDFKQFQYYTLPNAPVARHGPPRVFPYADDHGDDLLLSPHSGFHCCCYNLHMGWPKYVQHTWMATADGGLAAVAYGPTRVKTTVAGAAVTLEESTGYPFRDRIRIAVEPERPVEFPLKLRIPGWSAAATVRVNDQAVAGVRAGEFLTLQRTWKSGDVVTAEFPAPLETRNGYNGSAALWRGPLVFSLRIGQQPHVVTPVAGGFDELDLTPTTPWNYALDLDRAAPADHVEFVRRAMPANPWLPETSPLVLTVTGRRVPQWGLIHDGRMAAEVPESPVKSSAPPETLTLVPFGAQTLRITAFPLLRGAPIPEVGVRVSHHGVGSAPAAILDAPAPASSRGEGVPRFTFWDHLGTTEWLEWTFEKPREISQVSAYWFDDSGSGRCRVPAAWRVLHRKDGRWLPVRDASGFGTAPDRPNVVKFQPVTTTALRMEVDLRDGFSAGLLQWRAE